MINEPIVSKSESAVPASAEPLDASVETGTRAALREAIQKVMDEIEHHEREAKRHLQQAQELRKELRESVAFLQAGGQPAKPAKPAETAEASAKTKARDGAKKGPAGKRK